MTEELTIKTSLKEILEDIRDEGNDAIGNDAIGYEKGFDAQGHRIRYYLDLIEEGKIKLRRQNK